MVERQSLARRMLIIQAKGAIMKTTLIRTLTIAVLATSLSAFAETGAKKSDNAATQCDTTQKHGSKANTKDKQNKSNESQEQRDQDRLLLGIYG